MGAEVGRLNLPRKDGRLRAVLKDMHVIFV